MPPMPAECESPKPMQIWLYTTEVDDTHVPILITHLEKWFEVSGLQEQTRLLRGLDIRDCDFVYEVSFNETIQFHHQEDFNRINFLHKCLGRSAETMLLRVTRSVRHDTSLSAGDETSADAASENNLKQIQKEDETILELWKDGTPKHHRVRKWLKDSHPAPDNYHCGRKDMVSDLCTAVDGNVL